MEGGEEGEAETAGVDKWIGDFNKPVSSPIFSLSLTIIRLYTFFMYLTVAENKILRLWAFYEGCLCKSPLVRFRMLVEGVTSSGVG